MADLSKLPKTKRLAHLDELTLAYGSHGDFEAGVCALEAAAWLAGEKHSDHPECVCPAIAGFVRNWNDRLPNDEERNRILRPLLPLLLKTRGDDKLLVRRSYMAIDWDIRVRTPAFLRLAGLEAEAEALEKLPEIQDETGLRLARESTRVASEKASAARSAAWIAAWSAAGSAAWSAARSAAESAAGSAAGSAATEKFRPTVDTLQASAADLVKRMCALKPKDVKNWHWSGSKTTEAKRASA